ncbi:MAG: anion permease [Lentisphaeria bacterium]|nr:anion permease [Lentisphaeria bacterium]
MSETHENAGSMPVKSMISRFAILMAAALAVGFGGSLSGAMTANQSTACAVFIAIIFGTLFFWGFRLAIAFLGLAVLIFNKSMDIPTFVTSSSLEVIMFLVGMMVIVGALRDLGFFTWIVQLIVSMPNLSSRKFIFVTATASALLACAVDEVTSIIFISTLIFQVSDRLKLNATPYILIAVLATNIGSAGTMMGNPVGIFIGTKGQLSFGDFMVWAFPLMLVSLLVTTAILLWYFRKELDLFDESLKERLSRGLSIAPVVKVPYMRGLILIILTVVAIASHHQTEELLGLDKNSVLLVMPLICAGVVMILKPARARFYIENEVDWWTLIFFMLLFAVAGTLEHTHVDQVLASGFSKIAGKTPATLVPFIFTVSAFGSAFVDNVIFVAAFSPVIEQLSVTVKDLPLWWALLFGACFGGNMTMIGSTANIVALGMLEKHGGSQINFFQWFKIGFLCTLISGAIAVGALLVLTPYMPDHKITFEKLSAKSGYVPATEKFTGELSGSMVKENNAVYLANADGAKIQLISKDNTLHPGKVRVYGTFEKDPSNKHYPYYLKVIRITPVK